MRPTYVHINYALPSSDVEAGAKKKLGRLNMLSKVPHPWLHAAFFSSTHLNALSHFTQGKSCYGSTTLLANGARLKVLPKRAAHCCCG
jgi:hypothetical protein